MAEVDADGGARGGVEAEQDRRAAALRAMRGTRLGALDHEAVGLQVSDQARDRGTAQAGATGDFGTADLPLVAQRADDAQAVEAAERFK
jgi:hypothetical protein